MSQPISSRPQDESEFGGAPGLIQPPPHEIDASEYMTAIKQTDPSRVESSAESVREEGKLGRLR